MERFAFILSPVLTKDMLNPEGFAQIGPLFAAELKKAADCEIFQGTDD